MDQRKILIIFLPFFLLLFDGLFSISSQIGDRQITLSLFLAAWMVTWWIFEVLPLGVTALLPLVFFPTLRLFPLKEITPAYSNPVIFLFLGGFMIARALEKTKLDERIALNILKRTGHSDRGIVLGFIIATAFLSMWISNTATTVMMVPIALSVTYFLKMNLQDDKQDQLKQLSVILFLAIAYSANIGGVATPVGTPPNVVLMGYTNDLYSRNIDFYLWMAFGIPIVLVLLYLLFRLLFWAHPCSVVLPENFSAFIDSKINNIGRQNNKQKITVAVFISAALLWVFKDIIHNVIGTSFLNDTSIAIGCALLLFLIPSDGKSWQPVLELDDLPHLPWDIVLLFGGGMALASGLNQAGVIGLSTQWLSQLNLGSPYLLIVVVSAFALFLTEVMSNVALCVVALPLIMKLGEAQGIDPLFIAIPATLCTSFAFSMPISTPPNAIVFGTHKVTVQQMLKTGLIMNVIALICVCSVGYLLIGVVVS